MAETRGIGMLATIEDGEPRWRPMEFSQVDGEWWAAASRSSRKYQAMRDGQHVEVLFMNEDYEHPRIRGIVEYSTSAIDRQRLWALQQDSIEQWYTGVDDPNLVVLKIIPEQVEYKPTDGDHSKQKAA